MPDTSLRDAMAAAIRDAAAPCDGDCGKTETECYAEHPIQAAVLHFDVITDVYGSIDVLADTALAVVQPELDRLAAVEAAAPDWARDQTHRVMTVPVTALARKIAEKRDALAKLAEACREVDRLRAENRRAEVFREVADWIEAHDPADELTWFVDALRGGLVGHQCKQCYHPGTEATDGS